MLLSPPQVALVSVVTTGTSDCAVTTHTIRITAGETTHIAVTVFEE